MKSTLRSIPTFENPSISFTVSPQGVSVDEDIVSTEEKKSDVLPHKGKDVNWGWVTVHTLGDVPYCSSIPEEERKVLWWQQQELDDIKIKNQDLSENALDDKKKSCFARMASTRTVMKVQQACREQNISVDPEKISRSLRKINDFTKRRAYKRARDIEEEIIDYVSHVSIGNKRKNF